MGITIPFDDPIFAYREHTGDNVETDFTIGFPYLNKESTQNGSKPVFVRVYLDSVELTTDWSVRSAGNVIRFDTAPGDGVKIELTRDSRWDVPAVQWSNQSPINQRNLSKDQSWHEWLTQELLLRTQSLVDAISEVVADMILNDLNDVQVALTPGDYDVLQYDTGTSRWVNQKISSDNIFDNAIFDSKLADMGALSVKGNPANSLASPQAISATPASDAVLRESGSTLGFGQVATAGLEDNSVLYSKMKDFTAGQVLLGRDTGAGDPEEIALGTGLSIVGGSLESEGSVAGLSGFVMRDDGGDEWVVADHTAGVPNGNARGVSAVDLSTSRTVVNRVASADYSAVLGGRSNRAYASSLSPYGYAIVAGGQDNTAVNGGVVLCGDQCHAGAGCVVGNGYNAKAVNAGQGSAGGGNAIIIGSSGGGVAGAYPPPPATPEDYTAIYGTNSNGSAWSSSTHEPNGGYNFIGVATSSQIHYTQTNNSAAALVNRNNVIVGGRQHVIDPNYYDPDEDGSVHCGFIGGGMYNTIEQPDRLVTRNNIHAATISGGHFNRVGWTYSTIPGGRGAKARRFGEYAYAGGGGGTISSGSPSQPKSEEYGGQYVLNIVAGQTIDATPLALGATVTFDGTATESTQWPDAATIPFNETGTYVISFFGTIVGMRADDPGVNEDAVVFEVRGAAKKDSTGTVSLIGTPKVIVVGTDDAALDCSVALAASDLGVNILVTGKASEKYVWSGNWQGTEIEVPDLS